MTISPNKKIYFASDQHFGAPTPEASFPREQKFVAWLDEIKKDAECIFLLGDLFIHTLPGAGWTFVAGITVVFPPSPGS